MRHDVIEGVTGITALQSDPGQQLRGANRDMSTAEQATEPLVACVETGRSVIDTSLGVSAYIRSIATGTDIPLSPRWRFASRGAGLRIDCGCSPV
jgi:hypothetical protein